tara:strand:- start:711 stop:1280 length:570 start_codon:yes stop_codon:yes gene_type:complete
MSKSISPALISSTGIYSSNTKKKDETIKNKGLYVYLKNFLQKRRKEKENIVTRQNKKCFQQVEIDFLRILHHISMRNNAEQILENKISTDFERDKIIKYGNILVEMEAYKELSLDQIYMVLIFVYYGMVLIEQSCDWLTLKNIRFYYDRERFLTAQQLVYDISSNEILDENGKSISSEIRRDFLGLYNL